MPANTLTKNSSPQLGPDSNPSPQSNNPLDAKSIAPIGNLREEAQLAQIVDASAENLNRVADRLEKTINNAISNKLGDGEYSREIAANISKVADLARGVADKVEQVDDIAAATLESGKKAVSNAVNTLQGKATSTWASISGFFSNAKDGIENAAKSLARSAIEAKQSIEAIPSRITDGLANEIAKVRSGVSETIQTHLKGFSTGMQTFATGAQMFITSKIGNGTWTQAATNKIQSIADKFSAGSEKIAGLALSADKNIAQFENLVRQTDEVFAKVIDASTLSPSEVEEFIVSVSAKTKDGLALVSEKMKESTQNTANGIEEQFTAAANSIAQTGDTISDDISNFVSGKLGDGEWSQNVTSHAQSIRAAAHAASDDLKGFGSGIAKASTLGLYIPQQGLELGEKAANLFHKVIKAPQQLRKDFLKWAMSEDPIKAAPETP